MLRLTTDDEDDECTHNECTKGRMEKDDIDEGNIVVSLKRHGMFQEEVEESNQQGCGHT